MTESRFAKVSRIFLAACAMPPEKRPPYLDDACADDADLRREVEHMLAADQNLPAYLKDDQLSGRAARRAIAMLGTQDGGDAPGAPGDISDVHPLFVGRYRVLREIASGGMGTVYEAIQERPRRHVALKLIRSSMASRDTQRRFEREIEVLGRLRHPAIAQIYEAGAVGAESGRTPYFAMEFVPNARSISAYVRDAGLDLRARLRLFTEVCEAIHHGHEQGVVHRDIKPGNVLVDADGRPKVIDFGVAHVTDPDLNTTSVRTDVGQLVGTVQYMSPEQCAADPTRIDARTDVYALGIMLYKLVSDQMPYDLSELPLHHATRVIQEDEPTRLSSWDAALRGDVETIVGKAIDKDPDRRYESALALSRDIRRHLDGVPILARANSPLYVLHKRMRRHRRTIGVVALFVLLIAVAGTIIHGVNRDRQRLRDEVVLITSILESEKDADVMTTLGQISRVLFHADVFIDDFSPEPPNPSELDRIAAWIRRAGTNLAPLDEASLRTLLGRGWLRLESPGRALEHLERARTLRLVHGARPAAVADSVHNLARAHVNLFHLDEAEGLYRDALARRLELDEPDPIAVTESRNGLAGCLKRAGRYREAEVEYIEALRMRRAVLADENPRIAASINNLATCLEAQGRFAEARSLFVDARARLAAREANPIHLQRLDRHIEMCRLYGGELDVSPEPLTKAIETTVSVLGPEHAETASVYHDLALHHAFREHWFEATEACRTAARIRSDALPPTHPDHAASAVLFAEAALARGALDEAADHLGTAAAQYDQLFADNHPARARVGFLEAQLAFARQQMDAAATRSAAAVAIQREKLAIGHPHLQQSMGLRARVLLGIEAGEAESTIRPCIEAWRNGIWVDPRVRLVAGRTCVEAGRLDDAAALLDDAIAEMRRRFGATDERVDGAQRLLDRIAVEAGD